MEKQAFTSSEKVIRPPVVAGFFYPEDPTELRRLVENFVQRAEKLPRDRPVIGLVAPHAGYMYSGPVAGWAFAQIQGEAYAHVILVGPSHFEFFPGASVFAGDAYLTPLGTVPVDRDLCQKIARAGKHLSLSKHGHWPMPGGEGEHSLEVELPFLQVSLPRFQLVPIAMGQQTWEVCRELAEAIAASVEGQSVLLVASSDLSHYHTYRQARAMDGKLQEFFQQFAYRELLRAVVTHEIEACGSGPIATVMYASQLLGAREARVLKYATSGDVPGGDRSRVVGYMAGMLY